MKRALQLARKGGGRVSPNPMVGAVIVHGDRIIGEGFHAYYGGSHAEVNAIRSVKDEDKKLLHDSTIYVTLEPCAHFGKTPPCANLIVDTGIPRVIIGSSDPNPKVAGKGVEILKNAGIEVAEGVLEEDCDILNKRFLKAHKTGSPFVLLKWAQSSDGFMAATDMQGNPIPVKFSNPVSSILMHRERSLVDAIMVGSKTEKTDHPKLTTRLWAGNSPQKIVARQISDLPNFLKKLKEQGITSVMVEGGPTLLESFIKQGIYDEIRVETTPIILNKGLKAPRIPHDMKLEEKSLCRDNLIQVFRR